METAEVTTRTDDDNDPSLTARPLPYDSTVADNDGDGTATTST